MDMEQTTNKNKQVLLNLEPELYGKLINMASDSDRTVTQMLRNLIKAEWARQHPDGDDPSDDTSSPIWGEVN